MKPTLKSVRPLVRGDSGDPMPMATCHSLLLPNHLSWLFPLCFSPAVPLPPPIQWPWSQASRTHSLVHSNTATEGRKGGDRRGQRWEVHETSPHVSCARTYLSRQWAAVSTHCGEIKVPPQKCSLNLGGKHTQASVPVCWFRLQKAR